jgi:hypothetical protein
MLAHSLDYGRITDNLEAVTDADQRPWLMHSKECRVRGGLPRDRVVLRAQIVSMQQKCGACQHDAHYAQYDSGMPEDAPPRQQRDRRDHQSHL